MLAYLVLAPGLLFLFAGTLRWTMAWVYVLVLVAFTLGSRLAAWRRFPDLLAERGSFAHARDVKPWDRGLVLVIGLLGMAGARPRRPDRRICLGHLGDAKQSVLLGRGPDPD